MVARALWRSEALRVCALAALATSRHLLAAHAGSPTKAQPCVSLIQCPGTIPNPFNSLRPSDAYMRQ